MFKIMIDDDNSEFLICQVFKEKDNYDKNNKNSKRWVYEETWKGNIDIINEKLKNFPSKEKEIQFKSEDRAVFYLLNYAMIEHEIPEEHKDSLNVRIFQGDKEIKKIWRVAPPSENVYY